MNWIENILIIAGISLDTFAMMECQGSLIAKIEKKYLLFICFVTSIWQSAALYIGNFLSDLLIQQNGIADHELFAGNVIASVIFFGLGIRLMAKAIKNEQINERREENMRWGKLSHLVFVSSLYTLLAGLAFGFIGASLTAILIMIVCITIVVVAAGLYTGYHFGFEQKQKAYIIGAALLFIAGADVIVRHIHL